MVLLPNGIYLENILQRKSYTSYADEIKSFQWGLNDEYYDEFTTPLPQEDIADFRAGGGHGFFPVSESNRVTAKFSQNSNADQIVSMETSSGEQKEYQLYGTAAFQLSGKDQELQVFKPTAPESDYLFIPFTDLTNGSDTYAGGRYIEAKLPSDGNIVIDFNQAYHPYCAYTTGYSCPIPPAANHLEFKVEAGVKLPIKE
ncbi:hypothetical protein A3850_011930 [Lewinella sp. 4G2]|nr:hypothetical protein A3850_011930 [Lewinella sp. 4G2]